MKSSLKLMIATLGLVVSSLLGGMDQLLTVLLLFSAADYITGVMNVIAFKKLSSNIGAKGIFRKFGIYILVAVSNLLDIYIFHANNSIRAIVILFYISNEGISILENITALGLPVPKQIKAVLQQVAKTESTTDEI